MSAFAILSRVHALRGTRNDFGRNSAKREDGRRPGRVCLWRWVKEANSSLERDSPALCTLLCITTLRRINPNEALLLQLLLRGCSELLQQKWRQRKETQLRAPPPSEPFGCTDSGERGAAPPLPSNSANSTARKEATAGSPILAEDSNGREKREAEITRSATPAARNEVEVSKNPFDSGEKDGLSSPTNPFAL